MKNYMILFLLLACVRAGKTQTGCIQIDTCPTATIAYCIQNINSQDLWNDTRFLTPGSLQHDLPEGSINLNVAAHSTCGATLSISYTLYLDLDGDGVPETGIGSDSLPGFNNVRFGNQFGGGLSTSFDNRPVGLGEKYGFTKTDSINGAQVRAFVRWNTSSQPDQYQIPLLPVGIHKIRWEVRDNLGNTAICEYQFEVKDCKAPEIVCLNGLSANIMPTQMITLWASDFLQYVTDNSSPDLFIQLGIRKAGTGSGFPVDTSGAPIQHINFTCAHLGTNFIELWAKDEAGNTAYCTVVALIQDNLFNCNSDSGTTVISCLKNWCNSTPIENASVQFGFNQGQPPALYSTTNANGCAQTHFNLPINTNLTVTPQYDDNPLNNISTFDLLYIAQHILGFKQLSLYQQIAADINKSNSISVFDIVEMRKLILGIYINLPNNTTWRFVDANYQFPNPNNAFAATFPETSSFITTGQDTIFANFIGVKIGNIDCYGKPGLDALDARQEPRRLMLDDAFLEPGTRLRIPVSFADANQLLGFQFSIQYDAQKIEMTDPVPGAFANVDMDNFAIVDNCINAAWIHPVEQKFEAGQNILNLDIKTKVPCWLHDVFKINSKGMRSFCIQADEQALPMELEFVQHPTSNNLAGRVALMPNPTTQNALLSIDSNENQSYLLEVFDPLGRISWNQTEYLNKGTHTLEIPAVSMPQTGIYTWRLSQNGSVWQGKIVKQ